MPTIEPKMTRPDTVVVEPPEPRALIHHPDLEWPKVSARLRAIAPEAFATDGSLLNLVRGRWSLPGHGRVVVSPVDGSALGKLPMLDFEAATDAVRAASDEAVEWGRTDLDERRRRVSETLAELTTHRDALAHALMWEIGKPLKAARSDVDRCLAGVAWYVEHIEALLREMAPSAGGLRTPLGPISNIASWNYPLSVLFHAVLVQMLCGNAAIAKTPSDGGGYALAVCTAVARRRGLPVSLVSGSGGVLSPALVRNDRIDCLSFVGGRSVGRDIASNLVDTSKRYMLEMEGVNACGVWDFSQWDLFAKQLKRSYDYGKQRCTAYPRFVVQRRLLPKFIETYLSVAKSLKFGNPFLVDPNASPSAPASDILPDLDFGPLINAGKPEELRSMWSEATALGALPLHEGLLGDARLRPGQDRSAYFAPAALINPARASKIYHNEPFGPLDSIIVVDRLEELVAEMNISNGCLVSWLACDDAKTAAGVKPEIRAFKFGHNTLKSRGDNDEPFGGLGASWKGCFVGGKYLVQALTRGRADEVLFGNFADKSSGVVKIPPEVL